jgi:surface protein
MQRSTIIATDDTIHQIVKDEIAKYGDNADLNHIDVSKVTEMGVLFAYSDFNGNISQWDVSNVKDMHSMFQYSKFNGDLSQWNVSNVKNIGCIFYDSRFNGDISQWDVSSVKEMCFMFYNSAFNGDISQWDVSNVIDMRYRFYNSPFNGDISNWNLHPDCNIEAMLTQQEFILPPVLKIDDVDAYTLEFREALNCKPKQELNIKACVTKYPNPTAAHAVYLLLSSSDPQSIHPQLTTLDREQLEMLYQLTGSVYQSAIAWEKERKLNKQRKPEPIPIETIL